MLNIIEDNRNEFKIKLTDVLEKEILIDLVMNFLTNNCK